MLATTGDGIPADFDILAHAPSICAQLQNGDSARQIHEGLQRRGLDRHQASRLEASAVIAYCYDQQCTLPDGPK